MFKKVYVEITNICNLSCSFCHKTEREGRMMSAEEFVTIADRLKGRAQQLYFHLMGEPLLHPELPGFIRLAAERGFSPVITTNGTLLPQRGRDILLEHLHKINISLHSAEANPDRAADDYLSGCISFAKASAKNGVYTVFRLWNIGGLEQNNAGLLAGLKAEYPCEWETTRSGYRIADRTFIEFGEKFDWPDLDAEVHDGELFCYALRDQAGILCDGTVVPCCLDADGRMALGNILRDDLDEILSSDRARRIYDGFSSHRPVEDLCRRCGYASVTKKFRARDK